MSRTKVPTRSESRRREDFLAAFDVFGERIRRVLSRLCGIAHRDELDDLVQEAFLRAWRSWDSFDGRASRSTWLMRIAIHAGTDYLRKKRPQANETAVAQAVAVAPNAVDRVAVAAALATLSADLRATVVLYYFEEMTIAEIALVLEVPDGTVKSRLFSARAKLTKELGGDETLLASGGRTDAA